MSIDVKSILSSHAFSDLLRWQSELFQHITYHCDIISAGWANVQIEMLIWKLVRALRIIIWFSFCSKVAGKTLALCIFQANHFPNWTSVILICFKPP